MAIACTGDHAFAPSSDPHTLLRSVQLSEHAYNMAPVAPYDTAQLHVKAVMADGTPVLAPVQYSVKDSALFIDSSGVLHVRSTLIRSVNAVIYAAVTVSGVVQRDSAYVNVMTTVPQIPTRLAINGTDLYSGQAWNVPRSLVWPNLALGGIGRWEALDAAGVAQAGFIASARTSDSTVTQVVNANLAGALGPGSDYNDFNVYPVAPGHAWMFVSMYAFGKIYRDSLEVVIGRPQLYTIASSEDQQIIHDSLKTVLRFHPDSLTVPAGSDISWFAPPNCAPIPPDATGQSCRGTFINIDFDQPQYALASRIPPAYGTTPDVFESRFNSQADYARYVYNLVGGTGNIAPFGVMMMPDPLDCSEVLPINCRDASSAGFLVSGEARRFVTPGHYHYHTTQGASGVVVVE